MVVGLLVVWLFVYGAEVGVRLLHEGVVHQGCVRLLLHPPDVVPSIFGRFVLGRTNWVGECHDTGQWGLGGLGGGVLTLLCVYNGWSVVTTDGPTDSKERNRSKLGMHCSQRVKVSKHEWNCMLLYWFDLQYNNYGNKNILTDCMMKREQLWTNQMKCS